ncbi:hypothetical protein, partial [Salmonella sp. SAL4356]|uniref:hypothetical protein n=1 Tax=Salmonella sp. SAL4356 TaxID=3159877 RepID=UPI00397BC8F3
LDDMASYDNADPSLPLAECVLPDSGYTYRAMAVRDGANIGYNMVRECAQFTQDLRNAKAALAAATTDAQRNTAQSAVNRATALL